jgi:hypothetical protein
MKIDQVIRARTLQEVLRALDNNLTARDNFAPEGTIGQVLTSRGPTAVPTYQDVSVEVTLEQVNTLLEDHTHAGADITSGQIGSQYLGSGTRDGTLFLRDDGIWADPPVAWADITSKPTDFAGYGLDDDLSAALAAYYTKVVRCKPRSHICLAD